MPNVWFSQDVIIFTYKFTFLTMQSPA